MRVLDLGCGKTKIAKKFWPDAEIVGLDANPDVLPDVLGDVRNLPSDLGQFDAILASHVLEHLTRVEALPALKHWGEFLKSGGELHIMVPDLVWAAEKIVQQSLSVHVLMHIFGNQGTGDEHHKFGYTMMMLRDIIERAGYVTKRASTEVYGIQFPPGTEPVVARMLYAVAVRPPE